MKKIILFLAFLGLCYGSRISAQEFKRWQFGVAGAYGKLQNDIHTDYGNYSVDAMGLTIMPSLRYYLNNNWSVAGALLLPVATKGGDYSVYYTTGVELSLRRDIEVVKGLKISLSAVALGGLTGPYAVVRSRWDFALPIALPVGEEISSSDVPFRWQIGVRPTVSYQFANSSWGLELSYGFLGYRSREELSQNYSLSHDAPKGKFGFSSEMGWGNALRLGLTYSF